MTMKTIRRVSWLFGACALTVAAFGLAGATSQEPGSVKTSAFMRLKLEPAKGLLEGIALADFEMIKKNAGTMRNLMLDESWMVMNTEEYRKQSDEFRKTIEQIRVAANEKNIDGATLGYVQMTLRCVHCHQSLRK